MGSSGMWMNMAASGLSTILHLAMCTLFIAVAYFYVRPSRPDVWPLVAGWAGAGMFLTLAHVAASSVVPAFVSSAGGSDLMLGSMALLTGTFALLRAGVDGVLVYALVVFAKGRKPPQVG